MKKTMIRGRVLLFVVLIFFLSAVTAQAGDPANGALNRGIDYFEEGKYEKAVAEYDRALEISPDYGLVYYNRGTAYLRMDALDKDAGILVGSFTVEGVTETGEATIEKGGGLERAVRDLSEQVDREPLPVEQKEQVLRFQELLLGGGAAGTSEK